MASLPTEPVTPERFAGFNEAGFAKIAESTRVDPYGERFSIVAVESRVYLTDVNSRRRFRDLVELVDQCHHRPLLFFTASRSLESEEVAGAKGVAVDAWAAV